MTARSGPPRSTDRRVALPGNVRAMLWMLGAASSVAVMAAIIKHVTNELPLAVLVVLRMGFGLVPMIPVIARDWRRVTVTDRLALHLWRAFLGVLALAMYAYALRELVLADTVALMFTRPLWMIVIAIVLMGERVRVRRGLATVVGFAGVVIMVGPQAEIGPAMLVALGAAIVGCFVLLTLKRLATTEPAWRVVFYYCVLGTLLAVPFAVPVWVTPTPAQLGWLLASGVAATVSHYCGSRAAQVGDATVIAPMDYSQLPIAALIGFVVFAELPGPWSVTGTVIIVLATIYIARREAMLKGTVAAPDEAGVPPGGGLA